MRAGTDTSFISEAVEAAKIVDEGVATGSLSDMSAKLENLPKDNNLEKYVFPSFGRTSLVAKIVLYSLVAIGFIYFILLGTAVMVYSQEFYLFGLVGVSVAPLIIVFNAVLIIIAIRRLRFNKRYDKYVDLLKYRKIEITEDIAAYSGKPVDLVIRDLGKAVKLQFIPQGHFGKDQVIFISSDDAYEEYKSKQAVYDRYYRKQLEERMRMKERTKDMIRIMEKGQEYVDKIHASNDIIKDKVISQKLDRMENIVATIFHEVDINPAQSSKLGLLLNYYLPTTEKLLTAYIDLDEKMIKGKSLEKAKKDIENSLDTINAAFESILDKFYQEQELDIASDISAMEIMMQQEGL